MSWLLIFISGYVPVVVMSLLVLMNWLHRETQLNTAYGRLRGCRTEKVKFGKKAERPLMVYDD
jgi:hypothetical protein